MSGFIDIGHVHLRVGEIERALVFYRDFLGLEVTMTLGDEAAFLSSGGYHHRIALNTLAQSRRVTAAARKHRPAPRRHPVPDARAVSARGTPVH